MSKRGKKKQRRPSKLVCQRIHASKRAFERFGVALTRQKQEAVIDLIQRQQCDLIARQTNRLSVYRAPIAEGLFAPVVYDKTRKAIVTVLSWEMVQQWSEEAA
jgi:hypothetical protein